MVYYEEYLDIEALKRDCEKDGDTYNEIQEEIWILKEEYKQGGLVSPYIKKRKLDKAPV